MSPPFSSDCVIPSKGINDLQKICRKIKIVHKTSDKHCITNCKASLVFLSARVPCHASKGTGFVKWLNCSFAATNTLHGKKKSRSVNTEFIAGCWKLGWRVCRISMECFLYLRFKNLHEIISTLLIIFTFWMLRSGRIYLT